MNFVKLEKKQNYAILTLNNPKVLNAINLNMIEELGECIEELKKDNKIHACLFQGAGDKAFVAGADIAFFHNSSPEKNAEFCQNTKEIFDNLSSAKFISIAAIQGFALGGGLELALACDLRLANTSAIFALPEVSLGIIPGFGGTQRLSRLIPPPVALEMILTGSKIPAQRAYELGLVNCIFPDDGFLEATENYVQKFLSKNSTLAQKMAKKVCQKGLEQSLKEGQKIEQEGIAKLFASEDAKEGFSSFLEKRKANFQKS